MAVDGCTIKAEGTGDVRIELPNGSGTTQALLKDAVHVTWHLPLFQLAN